MLLTRREIALVAQELYKQEFGKVEDWSKISVKTLYEKNVIQTMNLIEKQIREREAKKAQETVAEQATENNEPDAQNSNEVQPEKKTA